MMLAVGIDSDFGTCVVGQHAFLQAGWQILSSIVRSCGAVDPPLPLASLSAVVCAMYSPDVALILASFWFTVLVRMLLD
jgi:hypothetical protein